MPADRSDSELAEMIAELARVAPADRDAILGQLDERLGARAWKLLSAHAVAQPGQVGDEYLSEWLAERARTGRDMTMFAQEALMACIRDFRDSHMPRPAKQAGPSLFARMGSSWRPGGRRS